MTSGNLTFNNNGHHLAVKHCNPRVTGESGQPTWSFMTGISLPCFWGPAGGLDVHWRVSPLFQQVWLTRREPDLLQQDSGTSQTTIMCTASLVTISIGRVSNESHRNAGFMFRVVRAAAPELPSCHFCSLDLKIKAFPCGGLDLLLGNSEGESQRSFSRNVGCRLLYYHE